MMTISGTNPSTNEKTAPEGPGRVGKYALLRELGRGGMGVVYEAFDTVLQRPVALKLLKASLAAEADHRARFLREARAAAAIRHANAVAIYEIAESDGVCFLALELVRGTNAGAYVSEHGPMPWREATRIVAEVSRALAAAHDAGILHRDVKPSNILLDASGMAKLADFGLARVRLGDRTITQPGEMLGTPAYMSPEQCRSEKADELSDIYSLGVTYYVLLTGRLLFEGETAYEIMLAHCQKPIVDPRHHRPDIPPACVAILERSLAKEPAHRYPSVKEMLRDLEALGQAPHETRRESTPTDARVAAVPPSPRVALAPLIATVQMHTPHPVLRGRSRRWTLGVLGLLLLAAVLAGAVWLGTRQHATVMSEALLSRVPHEGLELPAPQPLVPLAFAPNGQHVAGAGNRDGICVWRLEGEPSLRRFAHERVGALAFSPDSRWLALGGVHLDLMELSTGKTQEISFGAHQPQVGAVAFADAAKLLVVGLHSGAEGLYVRFWDIDNKKWREAKDKCHTREVDSIAVTPDGRFALTGGLDGKVGVWDLAGTRLVKTLSGEQETPARLALRSDGSRLAVGRGGTIDLYEAPDWKHVRTDTIPEPTAWALAYLPGDRDLLVVGGRGWVLDDSGRIVHAFHSSGFDFVRLALSPDRKIAALSHLSTPAIRLYKTADLARKGARP